ncbi:glycosyl transferase [Microbacterium oleivorans]|uniref:Putative glycosyl transferase n=1 Tax=Microbacterium oleivorans TaxID=273677 RepID=A0A031FRJ2_9MICO|nr:glycosyl transferase [Microbacterium oleivorans]EZP27479.1 putative glycosyl transferase [Microbacterium oleivorans]
MSTGDRLRVMQSFGAPRATSNPYVHMLDAALAAAPGLEHLRFDRRTALVGRYDALHFHWPETLFGGATPAKKFVRRLFGTLLIARLRLTRTAIVRTLHNVELPDVDSRWERLLLRWIDRRADFHIRLNESTPVRPGIPSAVIPHGHYRDWFAFVPPTPAVPRSLGFVGLVRRYKGVESLIARFGETSPGLADWTLRIAGNPSTGELADEIRTLASADERISLDLRYLSEEDFARAVLSAAGIVLPYRFMHNSGTALAALSLGRPVLVPRNEVNEALAIEVGEGWVSMFDGDLTADDLERFSQTAAAPPATAPQLDDRGWSLVGIRHRDAFARAVRARRGDA